MTSPAVMENPARIDAVKCQLQPEGKLSRCSTATLYGIVSECNAAAVQLVVEFGQLFGRSAFFLFVTAPCRSVQRVVGG